MPAAMMVNHPEGSRAIHDGVRERATPSADAPIERGWHG
jgi:hypothetical protein